MAAHTATSFEHDAPEAIYDAHTIPVHSRAYACENLMRDSAEVGRTCLGGGCPYPVLCAAVCKLMVE